MAFIILAPGDGDVMQDESSMQVQLSDEINVDADKSKSFEVNISEGVELGDTPP